VWGGTHDGICNVQRDKQKRVLAPAPKGERAGSTHHITTGNHDPKHQHNVSAQCYRICWAPPHLIIAFETELAMAWPREPRGCAGRMMPEAKYLRYSVKHEENVVRMRGKDKRRGVQIMSHGCTQV
jgi:hypothetical protein